VSEELRQKGYLDRRGNAHGTVVGAYEAFNLGATTLEQLRRARIIPDRNYGKYQTRKPDGLVVDRRGAEPLVKLVVEYKDAGGLDSESKTQGFINKVAEEYCRPLGCEFGGVSDHLRNSWVLVSPTFWKLIRREDDYPLDYPIDLASDVGRALISKTLGRLETDLNKPQAALVPLEAVNPTRLAEQTWQDIWLACGQQAEACLATFIEILIFKFLSDLNVLHTDSSGVPVDFTTVFKKDNDKVLLYYYDRVRPAIKALFPAGPDGTSIINGIVLDPKVADQGRLFHQILQRFQEFGSLRRIDPEFKSRIFERFLKKSISVKNWGQYFTPRNVVKSMVEMSGVEHLRPNAVLADPACGVGGFVLEPLMNKRPHDFRSEDAPNLHYIGWDRDEKTIILAKANMLVHLSELLENDPAGAIPRLASVLNDSFLSTGNSSTGSLARAPRDAFDLVMTNPPYVTRGTGKHRDLLRQDPQLQTYYSIPGAGVENLFVQLIINGLKPGARALVIVPDGLLLRHSEDALRAHILRTCYLEAIVSLPKDTFYSTPKKTYILVIRKKQVPGDVQREAVFTYLITEVGETRDAKRFVITDNDLPRMSGAFRLFQGNPQEFSSTDQRCKLFPIERFKPDEHWLVNKWWPREEREQLGDLDEEFFVSPGELAPILQDTGALLDKHAETLMGSSRTKTIHRTITLSLADKTLFRMGIGKRVLKKTLFYAKRGSIPLYSANVEVGKEHGWVEKSNVKDFSHPSLLWSIDSDFNMTARGAGDLFATTDHCGRIEILSEDLDPVYCQAAITYGFGRTYGFDRVTRPSLRRMAAVTFKVPVKDDGTFDLEAQRDLAQEFSAIQDAVDDATKGLEAICDLKPKADLPKDAQDMGSRGVIVKPQLLDEQEFHSLVKRWRKDTQHFSSVAKIVKHPAYRRIIAMGFDVLPYLFKELSQRPDHWLVALNAITGEDPVTADSTFEEAVKAWLMWGREKGHLQ
jgi:type I restriction-modification system DNA methylase subunit